MILSRLFRANPVKAAGKALYASVVARARRPDLYLAFGAPDTVEGRFELYTLHTVLLLDRLRGQGGQASEVSQALFDTYLTSLDDALREMGVGDLSVGKKMRRLGEAFYGRVKSYEGAFASLPDAGPLEALLARTVFEGEPDATALAKSLAAYVAVERQAMAARRLEDLLAGELAWGDR